MNEHSQSELNRIDPTAASAQPWRARLNSPSAGNGKR